MSFVITPALQIKVSSILKGHRDKFFDGLQTTVKKTKLVQHLATNLNTRIAKTLI